MTVVCMQAESIISVTHGADHALYTELRLLKQQCNGERMSAAEHLSHTAMITAD